MPLPTETPTPVKATQSFAFSSATTNSSRIALAAFEFMVNSLLACAPGRYFLNSDAFLAGFIANSAFQICRVARSSFEQYTLQRLVEFTNPSQVVEKPHTADF